MAEGNPPIPVPVAKVVGGTTVINSGTCFRAPDEVLDNWRDEHGVSWARDLDPYFVEAEEFLRVTPLDTERMGRNGQLAMEGAEALGVSSGPISRNAGDCVQCSSCPYGCRIDAKRGMHVSYLPRAVAAGAQHPHRRRGPPAAGRGRPRRRRPVPGGPRQRLPPRLHGARQAGDDRSRRRMKPAAPGPRRVGRDCGAGSPR